MKSIILLKIKAMMIKSENALSARRTEFRNKLAPNQESIQEAVGAAVSKDTQLCPSRF